jgi:hypothetical protein
LLHSGRSSQSYFNPSPSPHSSKTGKSKAARSLAPGRFTVTRYCEPRRAVRFAYGTEVQLLTSQAAP